MSEEENNVLTSDTDYLKELTLLPEEFPDHLKQLFWSLYTKDTALACLNKEDVRSVKNLVGLLAAVTHITEPDYEYTDSRFRDITNLKLYSFLQTRRGIDGFERIMQTRQTRFTVAEQKVSSSSLSPRRGFWSKLSGR